MRAPDVDPLAPPPAPAPGLTRDGDGRPLLKPRGADIRVPYTRMSGLGDFLSPDPKYLHQWELGRLLVGAGLRPDVARMAAALNIPQDPGVPWQRKHSEDKKVLKGLVEQALDAGGAHAKANYGTAVHSLAEPDAHGMIGEDDAMLREDIEGFRYIFDAIIQRVASELFVANDHLRAAGTFDGAVRIPGIDGLVCADWKTGKYKGIDHGVQMSGYANGELYDTYTDERKTFEEAFGEPVRNDVGLVVRVPAGSTEPVEKRVKLYLIDLNDGYADARVAAYIRNLQESTEDMPRLVKQLDPVELQRTQAMQAMDDIVGPVTTETLGQVYAQFKHVWTDALTGYGHELLAREVAA